MLLLGESWLIVGIMKLLAVDNIMSKPSYHWIKFDETKHWSKSFLAMIGPDAQIISTYIFDKNTITNACELKPSYELHRASTQFTTSRILTEQKSENIEDILRQAIVDAGDSDIEYWYCDFIDGRKNVNEFRKDISLIGTACPVSNFIGCDSDVTIDDVVEYYNENPW